MLETKALSGSIALERGRLTCRFLDDPHEIRRYDLTPRMLELSQQVHELWQARIDGRAPQVAPVVVVWGSLEPPVSVDRGVTYVRGDVLAAHLRSAESSDIDDSA